MTAPTPEPTTSVGEDGRFAVGFSEVGKLTRQIESLKRTVLDLHDREGEALAALDSVARTLAEERREHAAAREEWERERPGIDKQAAEPAPHASSARRRESVAVEAREATAAPAADIGAASAS